MCVCVRVCVLVYVCLRTCMCAFVRVRIPFWSLWCGRFINSYVLVFFINGIAQHLPLPAGAQTGTVQLDCVLFMAVELNGFLLWNMTLTVESPEVECSPFKLKHKAPCVSLHLRRDRALSWGNPVCWASPRRALWVLVHSGWLPWIHCLAVRVAWILIPLLSAETWVMFHISPKIFSYFEVWGLWWPFQNLHPSFL